MKGTGYRRAVTRSMRALLAASAVAGARQALADITGFDSGFTINNGALINNGTLQITDLATTYESRSAFFAAPQDITAFNAQFTYNLSGTGGLGTANGFTFILSNPANGLNALGGRGGTLGYTGINNSVAVEFSNWETSGTTLGTNGSIGTFNLTSPVDIRSVNNPVRIGLSYNGTILRESLVQGTNTYSLGYLLNVTNIVNASAALIGFTGATGAGIADQRISNFSYKAGPAPFHWNAADGNFSFAGNWSPVITPGSFGVLDDAMIDRSGGGTAHVTTAQEALNSLTIANNNLLSLESSASLLTRNLVVGGNGTAGRLNHASGTVGIANFGSNGLYIGVGGASSGTYSLFTGATL